MDDVLQRFSVPVASWFRSAFPAPTAVQARGWGPLAEGRHALLLAPTGSGKTLAAFLASLDRLVRLPPDAPAGVRVVYVSPLKALVADIERNLRSPLVGIGHAALRHGVPLRPVRVDVRTGDTPARERRLQAREPGDILVTTPESLYLLLGSAARETLRSVETVIVDEIHAVAGTKRGAHLALSLERLASLCRADPQRVGLSATQRPLEEIAAFLGGDRPVEIVDTSEPPRLDLRVVVPVEDMEHPTVAGGVVGGGGEGPFQRVGGGTVDSSGTERLSAGMWPAIYPRLLELIRGHRSTLIFTNSRLVCERLAQRLNELAGEELVLAHHGSVSLERRRTLEDALKRGQLPALVATSSLELGIDMGAVDLVVLVESPGSVSSGLQRVGRAGHQVGVRSSGRIFPKYRGDLVEAAVVARAMLDGEVEPTRVPRNCLDVLAQQIVAMVCDRPWGREELLATVRRARPYRELGEASLAAVLDMLSGRYPSDELADLQPRVVWDREKDLLTERRGARRIALTHGGTIPDRGLFPVVLGPEGKRVGELDEEMVYESRRGDLVILGASTWRIEEITRDRVVVSPAPGEPGRLPFWRGDRPGRPVSLGRRIGAFLRELESRGEEAGAWLQERYPLDELAVSNLLAYVRDQRAVTGRLPTDRRVVVESFRDELGDWRVCVLTPLGSRVHAPWALALEARYRAGGFDVRALWGDDGLTLRFGEAEEPPPLSELWIEPEELEELVVEQLRQSALFASRFRENAARSLLLPRRAGVGRQPLWAQRLRAQGLLEVVLRFPSFPMVLETYRECLQDVLDLPSLRELLGAIRSRQVQVHEVVTPRPSPFARSLVFAWVAAYMYEGDAPLAERRALALSLDRGLLSELLGDDLLRDLLDPEALEGVEAELQHRAEERRARGPDALVDVLRRLGDLGEAELAERSVSDPAPWLEELAASRRALRVRVAGESRWIVAEDAARYRDGLGVALPPGLAAALLEPAPDALVGLIHRFARTRGPFTAQAVAARFSLPPGVVQAALRVLRDQGRLFAGELRSGRGEELCDPEVLRRIKRRTLAGLRQEIAAVEGPVFASFLAEWHGLGGRRSGLGRLREVVTQLEGLPIAASALEEEVLPLRVEGFDPSQLDTLGATGELVWIGRGSLGARDGRIVLVRRERVGLLLDPPDADAPVLAEELPRRIHQHLSSRGASFLAAILHAMPGVGLEEATAALWDLAWAGLVTNDTFQPLRALRSRGRAAHRSSVVAGGRWSLVAELHGASAASPTARAHARALQLLERYGVVSGAAARGEELPGGFSAVYPVLAAMEEGGRARRGWFVEGLEGAQFASAGAVDRLRACRDLDPAAVRVVPAADPASPWGALLPWPCDATGSAGPRRVAGARVVSLGGEPLLYVERGERSWLTLRGAADPERFRAAVQAWLDHQGDRWRTVRVDRIDGVSAPEHPLRPVLQELGFVVGAGRLERTRFR